jgi:3-hydroxyisobutyrate dehydrogenase-like beta-hydroxyacid dehydrogenase
VKHIRFVGFGEAGRAFAQSLGPLGYRLSCYDIKLDTPQTRQPILDAAAALGATIAKAPTNDLSAVDWIILAVTAESSLEAAQSVLPALDARHVVIDINSVSPDRKATTCKAVEATGASYVDMAVMAPVYPALHRTRTLVAGHAANSFDDQLTAAEFNFERISETAGDATAVKMVRSMFVKGVEALTSSVLIAAHRAGCYERVVASLAASYPGLDWQKFPDYQVERMMTHGVRRAAEMRECAATYDEFGLIGDIAARVADMQQAMGELERRPKETLKDTVAELSAALGHIKYKGGE